VRDKGSTDSSGRRQLIIIEGKDEGGPKREKVFGETRQKGGQ